MDPMFLMQKIYSDKDNVLMVKTSPENFIIEFENQLISYQKGASYNTRCICRPSKLKNLSGETFVVFFQPEWRGANCKPFFISDYPIEHCKVSDWLHCKGEHPDKEHLLAQNISKMIPPLMPLALLVERRDDTSWNSEGIFGEPIFVQICGFSSSCGSETLQLRLDPT